MNKTFTEKQVRLLSNQCLLHRESDKSYFENVRKQGWCSEKQERVLENILNSHLNRSYGQRDMDEWWDIGYRDYRGQYDGEL